MIRIHTLGGLSVRGDDGKPLTGAAAQPRRMAILALLARAADRGITRDRVLALLWPDADDERGPRALAQALYALRRDLGTDEAIAGAKELRLDPAIVSSDVGEFVAAVARGDDARAASLYGGPFLDGFHLSGAEDFSRWAERERAALSNDYARVLESLGRASLAQGRAGDAVAWWRKVAALDPLNARFTMGLMDALVAAGDRAGAVKQAHVYHLLLDQELDLPPDREVTAYAARLRDVVDAPRTTVAVEEAPSSVMVAVEAEPEPEPVPMTRPVAHIAVREEASGVVEQPAVETPTTSAAEPRPARHPSFWFAIGAGAVAVIALAAFVATRGLSTALGPRPMIAVGRVTSYGADSAARAAAGPVSELLSTSLARVSHLRVVSQARMLELIQLGAGVPDTSAGGFVNAARRAGATEMVEGTVYALADGRLRLDLRRIDLGTGAIGDVQTVEGSNIIALVDSGTAQLVAALGAEVPAGSVADVTTRSPAAYGLYVEGMRTLGQGDPVAAERLFGAALREDSTFAMAAYYYGRVVTRRDQMVARLARAVRLSARATERERLLIHAGQAWLVNAPELGALADTLVAKYPQEAEGYLYDGIAKLERGDFLAAIPPLSRAVSMDSLSFARGDRAWECKACLAMNRIITAYEAADSLGAAEREARRYTRLQPTVPSSWIALWDVLERASRFAEAEQVAEQIRTVEHDAAAMLDRAAYHAIRRGDFAAADRLFRTGLQAGNALTQRNALWAQIISLRYQGQMSSAVEVARRFRAAETVSAARPLGAASPEARPLGAALDDAGRHREAAAVFDSIAKWRAPDEGDSWAGRDRAWSLTHAAYALAAAGDTARLGALADTIAAQGAKSASGRDQRLHYYVRGLLLVARNDLPAAESAFRNAIWSTTIGYTRANADLARVLLRLGKPREAVAVLQPALRGKLDASNYYVTHTELHDLLGRAWDAVGVPDSAAAHLELVARAWANGDPPFRQRAAVASARVRALR